MSQHLFLADMWYIIPMDTAHSGSDSDIGSASVDLEPANVTSSGQRSLLDVPQSLTCLGKEE